VVLDSVELVDSFNEAVSAKDAASLAKPSQEACRWCAYRPCCGAYFGARQPEWRGAQGDLHGFVEGLEVAPNGDNILKLRAVLPSHFEGLEVLVRDSPAPPNGTEVRCSVVDADVLGGPAAQKVRWNSSLVFFT
jgi:hypothetical protein